MHDGRTSIFLVAEDTYTPVAQDGRHVLKTVRERASTVHAAEDSTLATTTVRYVHMFSPRPRTSGLFVHSLFYSGELDSKLAAPWMTLGVEYQGVATSGAPR